MSAITRHCPCMANTWNSVLCPKQYGMFYASSLESEWWGTINYDWEQKSGNVLQKRQYWISTWKGCRVLAWEKRSWKYFGIQDILRLNEKENMERLCCGGKCLKSPPLRVWCLCSFIWLYYRFSRYFTNMLLIDKVICIKVTVLFEKCNFRDEGNILLV